MIDRGLRNFNGHIDRNYYKVRICCAKMLNDAAILISKSTNILEDMITGW